MHPVYAIVAAPAVEPVSLAEAMLHVRQDSDAEGSLITLLIAVARESLEKQYNLYLCTQTVDAFFPGFGDSDRIRIPRGPIVSVSSVKYTDAADLQSTVASTLYDADTRRGYVILKDAAAWPSAALRPMDPVVIRCVMGFGLAADVPSSIKQAILLRLGHLYRHREEVTLGNSAIESRALAFGVDSLMGAYRNWKLA